MNNIFFVGALPCLLCGKFFLSVAKRKESERDFMRVWRKWTREKNVLYITRKRRRKRKQTATHVTRKRTRRKTKKNL